VSISVHLVGAGFSVHVGDSMTQSDALELGPGTQESRQFIKLAGTIQEPPSSRSQQQPLTYNYDRIIERETKISDQAEKRRIVLPPGARLRSLADFFCSSKTMERIVNPIISDLQKEYCQALVEDRTVKARWIRIRGYWSFWKVLGYTIVKNLTAIWKASRLG
jgi:hypothetical protein